MHDPRYSSSSVLLFDPQSTLRHNTRVSLLELGFGEVEAVNSQAEFLDCLARKKYDLVVGDMSARDGGLKPVVPQMRRHIVGKNPFINIIVTLWDTTRDNVLEGIQSGADDILSRPMSANQLADRVQGLIVSRKPFIVTEDYLGPERRQIVRGQSQASHMVVPNSLKAKVEDRPELDATPENIDLAMSAVKDRRVSIFSEKFLGLSSQVVSLSQNLKELEERRRLITRMLTMNGELIKLAEGTEYQHIIPLCEAFSDVMKRIAQSVKEIPQQDKELLYQIPFAIHKACKEVRESAAHLFDIQDVSSRLRKSGS